MPGESRATHAANCCSNCCRRRSRRGCSAARSRISTGSCATSSPPPRSRRRRSRGYVTPRRLVGHRRRHPADAARPQRGAARPARRRAAAGDRRLPALGRARLDRPMRDPRHRPRRILFRGHQAAGPATAEVLPELVEPRSPNCPGRNRCAGRRVAALGAAADLDHLPLRRRGRAAGDRRRAGRPHDARPPLPVAGRDLRRQCRRLPSKSCEHAYVILDQDQRRELIRRRSRPTRGRGWGSDGQARSRAARRGDRPRRIPGRAGGRDRRRFHGPCRPRCCRPRCARIRNISPASMPTGAPAPRFLFVANNLAEDGGKAIVAGNERVLRARLADARFFWDQDRKVRLEDRVEALKERVYHAKLGSVYDKVERMERLAEFLARYRARCRCEQSRSARRALPRPICRPAWSASFPNCRGSWAATTRCMTAKIARGRRRDRRALQAARPE